jgi:class 3 adenylate cyclase
LHTGECEETADGDIAGIAVHVAARVQALADGGEIMVTSTLKDLVLGSGLPFAHRGEHTLKGIPGPWTLWAVPHPERDRTD